MTLFQFQEGENSQWSIQLRILPPTTLTARVKQSTTLALPPCATDSGSYLSCQPASFTVAFRLGPGEEMESFHYQVFMRKEGR